MKSPPKSVYDSFKITYKTPDLLKLNESFNLSSSQVIESTPEVKKNRISKKSRSLAKKKKENSTLTQLFDNLKAFNKYVIKFLIISSYCKSYFLVFY